MKKIYSLFFFLALIFQSCSDKTVSSKPEPVVAERPAAPYPEDIWIDEGYRWDGAHYVVVPGRWVKPRPHKIWVSGHWKATRRGYRFIPGHWR